MPYFILYSKVVELLVSETTEQHEENKKLKRQRNIESCASVFHSLLEFAMDVQSLRESTKNSIPRNLLSKMRKSFVLGNDPDLDDEQPDILLNQREYTNYINGTGFWRPAVRKSANKSTPNHLWSRFQDKCEKIIRNPVRVSPRV